MDANKTQPPSEKSMVKSAKLVWVAGKYVEMEVEFNDGRGTRMIPDDTPGLDSMELLVAAPGAQRIRGTIPEIQAFLEKQDPTKIYNVIVKEEANGGASTPPDV